VDVADCDTMMTQRRVCDRSQVISAVWTIFHHRDANKIRDLLNRVAIEKGRKIKPHLDPIHDQSVYLNSDLRKWLYEEYGVVGCAFRPELLIR